MKCDFKDCNEEATIPLLVDGEVFMNYCSDCAFSIRWKLKSWET